MRRTMRLLKKVQIEVEVEKLDTHKGVSVKALLDSRAMELFTNRKFIEKQEFKKKNFARVVVVMRAPKKEKFPKYSNT